MDPRKPFFFEHFFSSLSSKRTRRVFSGFGMGVVASLLILSLLATLNTSSPFSWFFSSAPNPPVSHSDPRKPLDFSLGVLSGNARFNGSTGGNHQEPVLENTHDRNSSRSSFSGRVSDLGSAHVDNSSVSANGERDLEKTHQGHSSRTISHFKNSTEDVKNSSSSLNSKEAHAQLQNVTKDDGMTGLFEKKDGAEGKDHRMEGFNTSIGSGEGRENGMPDGSVSTKAKGEFSEKCNLFNGRWVRDESKPYYPPGSCPHIDDDFNCHKNGRPDTEFLKWKWQPNDCNIPSLNATDFLARLRGKRLIFVGDSLNRNMWESLVCILRHSVERKSRVFEVSGRSEFKTKGYYSFRFEDYECSVDFVRSPFLVRELFLKNSNGSDDERLRLDVLDETAKAYKEADIIIFNTGHWWTHEKTSRGIDYYQEGDHVYPVLKVMEAYKKALTTWAKWIDENINSNKTQVVFRGYSLTHFRGGQWNSGGQCHKENDPIFNETFLAKYPSKMRAFEGVIEQMKTPVIYLNISKLTDYRKDGHPSIYRKKYDSVEEQIAAETSQDCSHWCLPGIPDTWNELLYASLLINGKGSWSQ